MNLLRPLLTFVLLVVQFGAFPQFLIAQNNNQTSAAGADNLAARLDAIEKAVAEKQKELGVPGIALAIVKDDKVIFVKGFGLRDRRRNLPVTPDTLFGIGSSSKAFTSMAAVMTADEGKLSLDDSPKKFLPYFKLRDPEADANVTLRDMMCHRTGLDRTDLSGQFPEKLTREDAIKLAGLAKPTAKFRQEFQYQNTMFAAVGESVAKANAMTWEQLMKTRLFKPLGMKTTNTSIVDMEKSKDFSRGYDFDPETKETRDLITMDQTLNAPAGAINSSAREMTQWLRLMLGGGAIDGKRLVSEKNFSELVKQQMQSVPGHDGYGLGWFLDNWHGKKEVDHGGNIEGFSTMVSMIPEEHLGFVMLNNVTYSPLQYGIIDIVYSNLLGGMKPAPETKTLAGDMRREVGKYSLKQPNLIVEVSQKDGKLMMQAEGRPDVFLENVGGRRYKFSAPAPDGFFVTFRPAAGNENETELLLEQPNGSFTLSRIKDDNPAATGTSSEISPALKEIIGNFESERNGRLVNIVTKDSDVYFQLEGQPPLKLRENGKDKFAIEGLPDGFILSVKRDEAGRMNGLLFDQQGIVANLRRQIPLAVNIDELMNKVIEAAGGEANLRKHTSMRMEQAVDFEGEGMTGETIVSAKAPNLQASNQKFIAFGREVGENLDYFDGKTAGSVMTSGKSYVGTPLVKTGKLLEDARIAADFYAPLDWKKLYQKINVRKITKIGDQQAYVVEKIPASGHPVIDYISTESFLVLRRDSPVFEGYNGRITTFIENFSDYRSVDGVMMPFKIISGVAHSGVSIATVKSIEFNVDVPNSKFRPAQLKKL